MAAQRQSVSELEACSRPGRKCSACTLPSARCLTASPLHLAAGCRDFEAKERLVGTRVSVYWPGADAGRWYDGRVTSFDEQDCTHRIQ